MQVEENASQEIAIVLSSLGCRKPLIIANRMMVGLGYVAKIQGYLASSELTADEFADTAPEPAVDSIAVQSIERGINHEKKTSAAKVAIVI